MKISEEIRDVFEAYWVSKIAALASTVLEKDSLLELISSLSPRGYRDRVLLIARLSRCLAVGPHHKIFAKYPRTIGGSLHRSIQDSLLMRLQRMLRYIEKTKALKASYMLGYVDLWKRTVRDLSPEEIKDLILGYSAATAVNMLSELLSKEPAMETKGYLVLVDARRVMEYIGESRRPRDMMISSLLASLSVWASINKLISTFGLDILLIPFPPASELAYPLTQNIIYKELGSEIPIYTKHKARRYKVGIAAKTPAQMLLLLPGSSTLYEELFRSTGLEVDIMNPNNVKDTIKKIIMHEYTSFWKNLLEESLSIANTIGIDREVIWSIRSLSPEPPLPLKVEILEPRLEIKSDIFCKNLPEDATDLCSDIFIQKWQHTIHEEVRKIYGEEMYIEKGRPIVANLEDLTYRDYISGRIRKICSVCGVLPAVFEWEKHGRSLKGLAIISEGENLCVYCFTKRMLSTVDGVIAAYRASIGSSIDYILKLHKRSYKASKGLQLVAVPIAPSTSDIAIHGTRKALVELLDKIDVEDLSEILKRLSEVLKHRKRLEKTFEDFLPKPQDISYYTYDLLRKLKKKAKAIGISKRERKYLYAFLSKSIEELIEKPMTLKSPLEEYMHVYEREVQNFRKEVKDISTAIQKLFNKYEISPLEVGRVFTSYYSILYSDMDNGGRIKRGELVISKAAIRDIQEKEKNMIPPSCDGNIKERDIGDGYETYEICMTIAMIHLYSASLLILADDAEKIILDEGGWPIYIGGDDIIALTNVGNALKIAQRLRDSIERSPLLLSISPAPTRSTSILISHYKNPLYMAFAKAREILKVAKDTKLIDTRSNTIVKTKDSLSITILFRGMAVEPQVVVIPHIIDPVGINKDNKSKIRILPILQLLADCISRGGSQCLSQSIYRDYRKNLAHIEDTYISMIASGKDHVRETLKRGLRLLIEINSPRTKISRPTLVIEDLLISLSDFANYVIIYKDKSTGIIKSILDASETILRGLEGFV